MNNKEITKKTRTIKKWPIKNPSESDEALLSQSHRMIALISYYVNSRSSLWWWWWPHHDHHHHLQQHHYNHCHLHQHHDHYHHDHTHHDLAKEQGKHRGERHRGRKGGKSLCFHPHFRYHIAIIKILSSSSYCDQNINKNILYIYSCNRWAGQGQIDCLVGESSL